MSQSPLGHRIYPYQYANLHDQDDEPSGHHKVSRLNSPDITHSSRNLRSPSPSTARQHSQQTQQTTTPREPYSSMGSPISPLSPAGQERGFNWQELESVRGSANTSGSKSAGKRATIMTPGPTLDPSPIGGYSEPDLDSLLETPYRSSNPEGFDRATSGYGHRRGNSDAASVISSAAEALSPSTPSREKRKSMTATIGEKAFKSPILTKSTTSIAMTPGGSRKLHPTEIIDQRAEMTAQWGIYWYLPSLMVAVFIAGLVGALGHHAFYKSLHGQEANDQLSMVRIGTAFAFFVKANLVGAVVLAYRQRIWLTMRKKAMRLRVIDALFGIIEDPTFFLTTPEIIKNAKLASLMALITWLIPIASVLSPSSLTSELSHMEYPGKCFDAPTLNFSAENDYDFRTAKAWFGNSLSFYNTTDFPNSTNGDMVYDMPSYQHQRLASQAIYNHGPASPSRTPCSGHNCTYVLTMPGPGYQCEDVDEDSEVYDRMPPEVGTENLVPNGIYIYYANVKNGDYFRPNNDSVYPGLDPNPIVGTFYFEPELWIGYTIATNETLPEPIIKTVKVKELNKTITNEWSIKYEPKVFHCVHYHVEYTFNVSYINTQQSVNVTDIKYIRPIIETDFKRNETGGIIPPPDISKFLRPGQEGYKLAAVYHAIGSHLRKFLAGRIYLDNNMPFTQSEISMTNLVRGKDAFPIEDLDQKLRNLHQDILINFWTAENLFISANQTVECTKSRYLNVYKYHTQNLWIGYSIVVVVTLASIIVGAMSLLSNGISSDTLFSRILVTTRNPTLDHLSRGACLGSDPFPRELEETKLRFGVWHEGGVSNVTGLGLSGLDGKPGHCAFGTIHETTEIVKGGLYAGLDVNRGRGGFMVEKEENEEQEQYDEKNDEQDVFYECSSEDESQKPLLEDVRL